MGRKLLLFLFIISCTSSSDVLTETSQTVAEKSLSSEEILIEIFETYKVFSEDPVKAVNTIWSYAHEKNQEKVLFLRREWDLNPRYSITIHMLSRHAP